MPTTLEGRGLGTRLAVVAQPYIANHSKQRRNLTPAVRVQKYQIQCSFFMAFQRFARGDRKSRRRSNISFEPVHVWLGAILRCFHECQTQKQLFQSVTWSYRALRGRTEYFVDVGNLLACFDDLSWRRSSAISHRSKLKNSVFRASQRSFF